MTRTLTYRDGGITGQTVETVVRAAADAGATVEVIRLPEYPVGFHLNCRECTQRPGEAPYPCVQHDGMAELVDKIEAADAYWPWEINAPQFRKAHLPKKRAVFISSCTAPGIMGRWLYGSRKQLSTTAKTIDARAFGTLFVSLIAKQPHPTLPAVAKTKL